MSAVIYLGITSPKQDIALPNLPKSADIANGQNVFIAAGCGSCHRASGTSDPYQLSGGKRFETRFGTFYAPNISNSHQDGIGDWKFADFYRAVKLGRSPSGENYYPVFPYTSYANMSDSDIYDLWGFWQTLPSIDAPNQEHDIHAPFKWRRNIAIWNMLFAGTAKYSAVQDRATYLVEALGHCAQCHTPRSILGGLNKSQWLRGGVSPDSKSKIPSIHPQDLQWSKEDIVEYLTSGFTPDYDMTGAEMVEVIENTAQLSQDDRALIADYLLRLPAQ